MPDPEDARLARLIDTANGLSDDAAYVCAQDYFSTVLMNKPILPAPQHGDVERGVHGYRSTYHGRDVAALCRRAMSPPKPEGGSDD